MTNITFNVLSKRKKEVLQSWINTQIEDPTLREDLMANEDMHAESEELLNSFINAIKSGNYQDIDTPEYRPINEILSGVALSRAQAGFSPRETATFVLSLKRTIIRMLQEELKDEQETLMKC